MSPPHRSVDPRASFPELEEQVLARWRERDVFAESLRRRRGAEPWGFYEGPPTANGPPGAHHVLSRVFKDIFPRYKTMRGHYVERKAGWDCHGLAVEIEVERQLGFNSKHDIERYGIAEFNQRCRDSVFEYVAEWNRLTDRIGFWLDLEDPYRTLDPPYIESVWWALKTIYEKGLLFEKHKVVPYCPRCGTALSSHELGQPGVYRDVIDPSLYVRFPVVSGNGPVRTGDELLIWTTTPWTLVSNAAVAVDPELTYVRARVGDGSVFVLAEPLIERVLGSEEVEVLERFRGDAFAGTRYEPPFPFIPASDYGERGHTVLVGDFVTAQDGTGLVHTAIAFGEDDFRLGEQYGLNVINPVLPDGTYDERIGPYAGRNVKDADPDLVEDLRARGRLLRAEPYEHSYPHCWRCGTPLLYYAKPSWYIATSRIKDKLLASNETVNWHPEHVKHGRFGNWLEGNVDWALSRERYWGTPLPIWRCPNGHVRAIGSLAELNELSGASLTDPHRPYVDEVGFRCAECEAQMQRVPEVIDVWFDSGSMPFAQYHAPHAGTEQFERHFPADFICEALDQTRGWFYSLLAVSTLLFEQSSLRRRRVPVVFLHVEAAVGRLPVLARGGRRGGQAVPASAVEHVRLLRAVRECERDRARRLSDGRLGIHRARPVGALAVAGDRRGRPRAPRRIRRDYRRPGDRRVRRRAVELVRAALAPAFLGRRSSRLRDVARGARHRLEAARAVHPLRRRRDLRQPRRGRAQRSPDRLPGAGRP
jgi:isoleucyl-tRNA synthetase